MVGIERAKKTSTPPGAIGATANFSMVQSISFLQESSPVLLDNRGYLRWPHCVQFPLVRHSDDLRRMRPGWLNSSITASLTLSKKVLFSKAFAFAFRLW